MPVTSNHDYFGISVLEAALCETRLLLPKRNAYPDHFKPDKFSHLYYKNDSDFKEKLSKRLIEAEEWEWAKMYFVEFYWSKVRKGRDEEFINSAIEELRKSPEN